MGYSLKIKGDGFIDIEEWTEILEATKEFVRLSQKEFEQINGPEGQSIRFPVSDGAAEVYFPSAKEWHVVFSYNDSGYITFRSPRDRSSESPAWTAAVALATLLDGQIVGEEGELYDLTSGEQLPMTEADRKTWEKEILDEYGEDEDEDDEL